MHDMTTMNLSSIESQLHNGVKELGLGLDSEVIESLLAYIVEFQKWNKTHNLSSIHSLEDSVVLHLLDSLSVLPHLDAFFMSAQDESQLIRIADLGTGGGLPGIPLAICRPSWNIYLMEAVQKKTVFLQHIVSKFNIKNAQVLSGRIEETSKALTGSLTCCISRAFSDFGKFVDLSAPMLVPGGVLWAMKARLLDDDLSTIPPDWEIKNNYSLQVPFLEAERRLFELVPVRK
jgi:16S rRNA (guanine527-N7)-methyltransferase